jgi:hypothetical protein
MYLLSFDPGKTTGWCSFDATGNAIEWGQVSLDELMAMCDKWEEECPAIVVYEDWLLFKHKAQKMAGSRMESSQAIGIIKNLARKCEAELVVQGSDIKPTAEKFTQMKAPSNHAESHWVDAFNHGAYYLINKGIRKTYLEMEQESKK